MKKIQNMTREHELIEEQKKEMISMDSFAKMNTLYLKQGIASDAICSTFVLDCIEKDV